MQRKRPDDGGIRAEILREWRGCDEAIDLGHRVHAAQRFIDSILGGIHGATDGLDEDEVRSTWKELAGDFVARHSEPVSVRNGDLVLRVTQPAMRFHLEQQKPLLLARIRGQLGEDRIRSVRFTLG